LSDAENDLHNCHWWQKIGKAAIVAEAGSAVLFREGLYKAAEGALKIAQDVVDGSGKLLKEAVHTAQDGVDGVQHAGDTAIEDAQSALEVTRKAGQGAIELAQKTLDAAKTGADELGIWNAAKKALSAAMEIADKLVEEAEDAVNTLQSTEEWLAYHAASAALQIVQSATHEVDLCKGALTLVEEDVNAVAAVGTWIVTNAGNVFNIHLITLTGNLAEAQANTKLTATVDGVFAGKPVNLSLTFKPGSAVNFIKEIFSKAWDKVKKEL